MSDTEWSPRNVGLHNTATQLRAVYIQISLQHQHNNNLFITCLLGTDAFRIHSDCVGYHCSLVVMAG